ncbi:MAG: type II toxin-antitoxin system HicB family antitoxin [Desulfovibrionaceae bacterium]|nr:type II toxin-antitoxin system HicB family antitoxin [Desulfovibrionaceae bacterium]
MASYFAVIMPAKEGGYVVDFPDIPEAFTQGDTLEECVLMGADVLAIAVEEYAKARKELPPPSTPEKIEAWAEEQKSDPDLAPGGRFLMQLFRAPDIDSTPIRVSISLAKSTLERIDEKAKLAGYTRSGFLAAAAQSFNPQ